MKCPECGHDAIKHFLSGSLCSDCEGNNGCRLSQREVIARIKDIELAAWKAEAMAARRVLGSAEWNDADFVAYMAARVKDGE